MRIIFEIALKDLSQLLRDRKTFLFTLFMPAVFTVLMGYAFGGFDGAQDARLPVGWIDRDQGETSRQLYAILDRSDVIRMVNDPIPNEERLSAAVADGDLAAAIIIPPDFDGLIKKGKPIRIRLIADAGSPAGTSVESELLSAVIRIEGAIRAAAILEQIAGASYLYSYTQIIDAWDDPPLRVVTDVGNRRTPSGGGSEALAHTSPGMMLQFAIAGLLVSAQLMVNERRTQCLQRLLTTSVRREQVLLGHFTAIFLLTVTQFALLIAYGQILLNVPYLSNPAATFLVASCAALCIAGLGTLIGVLARTEEQAVVFALVPMFILVGVGGGWMPLEVIGEPMQTIGHLSPVAWGMDGFKNVIIRGQGLGSVLLPATALTVYAVSFLLTALLLFRRME